MRASTFNPKDHDNYQPNPVQMEFIRLVAEKYWYLAFGDVDHNRPSVSAFALNKETVRTLAQAGKEGYFLEEPVSAQKNFDDVLQAAEGFKPKLFNSDFLLPEDKEGLSGLLSDSVRANRDVQFICADTRLGKASLVKRAILGSITDGRAEQISASWLKKLVNKAVSVKYELLSDDRKTASMIKSFGKPSAILFGAGHFYQEYETEDRRTSMRSLLPEEDKSLCVLNILAPTSWEPEVDEAEAATVTKPDAELYVPPYKNPNFPYGIKVINPDLQPLLDRAVKAMAPQPRIRVPQPEAM